MRRWNGWGDEQTTYPLAPSALSYLQAAIGNSQSVCDVDYQQVLDSIPAANLPAHELVSLDAGERLLHARGQSFPDWIALRSGRVGIFPDGVAFPRDPAGMSSLMAYANRHKITLIPYGGGTSVVGHINPLQENQPNLVVDLGHLDHLLDLDETSRLATFECGINGPALEMLLQSRGYTLGHFPQSFELSTLGGWIATRSAGQQSHYYGRIEDLFAGGHVVTPQGELTLPIFPASAAGPDLRQLVLGSEGRLGVITHATVRIHPLPEREGFYGVFFPSWEAGVDAVRIIVQEEVPVSMLRLSDARETEATLALSGKTRLVSLANRGLGILGYRKERCLLIFGVTGSRRLTDLARRQVLAISRKFGGLSTGSTVGKMWKKSRFLTPYLRNTLWEQGYGIDTLETALPWSRLMTGAQDLIDTLKKALHQDDERALIFAHLSHVYPDGASIYITFIFRLAEDPDRTLERWCAMKKAASRVIIQYGGTISHQHGVGMDHRPYLAAEKGALGIEALRSALGVFDPQGILNPGKLLDTGGDVSDAGITHPADLGR